MLDTGRWMLDLQHQFFLYIGYMKSKNLIFFTAILLILNLSGCNNTITQPDLHGNMIGFVYTFDEYSHILEKHDNVLVTALGNGHYTTKTDVNGRFEFKGIPAGTYELDMEKEGFNTMKQFGIQHLGGEPTLLGQYPDYDYYMYAFFLFQTVTSTITDLSFENDTLTAMLDFHGNEPSSYYVNLLVYFSGSEGFEMSEAEYTTEVYLNKNQDVYVGEVTGLEKRFGSGKKLFFKGSILIGGVEGSGDYFSGHFIFGITSYFDYFLHETIYPNLGPLSNEYNFIIP
jgi:hypothetical protein